MRIPTLAKLLGTSAALVAAVPLVTGSALAWSNRQSSNYRMPPRYGSAYTEGAGSSAPMAVRARRFAGREVASRDMWLHFGPNAKSPKKLVIAAGTPLRTIGGPNGQWRQVATPIGTGWTMSRNLSP